MDRKVIRTYKDYMENGNQYFEFDTWMNKMTEDFDGSEYVDYDEEVEHLRDLLHDELYVRAKEKLSKSRLFDGASKFSVVRKVENSAIGYANPKKKAEQMLKVTNAPFSIYYSYLHDHKYKNIIFNEPFEEEGLTSVISLALNFLLTEAAMKDNNAKLFRTTLVLNMFIELNDSWRWQHCITPERRVWRSSEKDMTEKGVEVLNGNIKILAATERSAGLKNLKTVVSAYDFLPKDVANKIINDYLENALCPSDETTTELFNSLSDEVNPNLLDIKMPKVTGLSLGDRLYHNSLRTVYMLPFPIVLVKSLKKKLSHIPNAKGQMKMAVKGLNNLLYNPRLTTMMMQELSKDVEDNNLWNTDLGVSIITNLYEGFRETLGKTAWKDIAQQHFTYEHVNDSEDDIEIIFSLEKEDIWTASSAGNSWSSCHAATFGHSPIFMGGDEVTFVAYEKGSRMADEGVDSKRWRAYCHLWYDKNDKNRMIFSVEHAYPNGDKRISEVVKDIILDGLELKYTSTETIFNHATINVLEGTTSHGYYDYNECQTPNYFTFDIESEAEEWDEEFMEAGLNLLSESLIHDVERYREAGVGTKEVVKNLGFLLHYCNKKGIDLIIPEINYLHEIGDLGDDFTAVGRATYMLIDKDADLSFGSGLHMDSLEEGVELGAWEQTSDLSLIVSHYCYPNLETREWYY